MKYGFFTVFIFPFLFLVKQHQTYSPIHTNFIDSGHIVHILDGSINEWPADKFHLSDDSTMEYAMDNDSKNLYVALTIPDFSEQTKIMKNGMKLFIDLKGKKKEGKGVEFPVKGEGGNPSTYPPINSGNAGDEEPKKLDRKTERSVMALGLVALKLFGFGKNAMDEQGLTMSGSVNIAFKWDDFDAMHIEYNIPLELLGEAATLNQKDVAIGWKINGFERPEGEHSYQNAVNAEGGGYSRGTHAGGGRGQSGGGGGGHAFGNRPPTTYKKVDPDEMRKEQNIWTKYTISL